MVQRILSFLNKEISSLHQTAILLGFFVLLSQFLGMLRDKLLAHYFGAGLTLDLYYASFRTPDFLFITIGSLVSIAVVIPFLLDAEKEGSKKVRKFIDSIFTSYFVLITLISTAVFFLLPVILPKIFPGFDGNQIVTLIKLTRILLISPVILGISNLLGSLTQSHNRFFVYAISPILYNLGIIIGILFLYPKYGLAGLAMGVIVGALLHAAIQIPPVIHLGLLPRFTFKPDFSVVKRLFALSFPRTITLSIAHISVFFLISLASVMSYGSISVFNLAFNIQSVPLSIIGVSYSMAAFPTLARFFSSGSKDQFLAHLISSAKHIVFWTIPFSIIFIVLRAHIVRVILGSGQFSWSDTRLTAAALALFAFSLVFQSLVLLFVRAIYAMGNTGKPFYLSIVSGAVIVLSSIVFLRVFEISPSVRFFFEGLFKVSDLSNTDVLVLPLGFTLGSIIDGLLMWLLVSKYIKGFTKPILRTFFEAFSSSTIMGFVIFISLRIFNNIFSLDSALGVFAQGLFSGLIGIMAWIVILYLLKSKELKEIWDAIHQKFWKTKPISPDSQIV